MASSMTEGLVPITRASLARYYDKYPAPSLSEDIIRLTAELRSLSDNLLEELPLTPGEQFVAEETYRNPPHKVDENLWKNREYIEEILYLLDKFYLQRLKNATDKDADIDKRVKDLQLPLQEALKALETFQSKNSDFVFNTVMTYMPQDFRGALIRQQRERSERNKQALVDALINSGGSIHDRYALLWNQQMERRRQLAQLGSAQGVYKTVVKYLVGVPQVLLDFIKQINDDQGPMEEQRQRYGPSLYSLTKMVLSIRFFLLLSSRGLEKTELLSRQKDQLSVVEKAVEVYTYELKKFIKFIRVVFENSPFFISAEDAGATESRKRDDYKETVVPAGKTHEVTLTVESVNSYIAWDFSLTQGTLNRGQDIGFHVEYVNPSGGVTLILPYRRYESDQGNFSTILTGSYKLVWDNSYSTFLKKYLRYKVDAVPPVDPPEPVTDSV